LREVAGRRNFQDEKLFTVINALNMYTQASYDTSDKLGFVIKTVSVFQVKVDQMAIAQVVNIAIEYKVNPN